jgi:formamidopyrimidine-DNA glycosylase
MHGGQKLIELPEAMNLAIQLNKSVKGKEIASTVAAHSPHKFAWYHGDPKKYGDLLLGKTIGEAAGWVPWSK